MASGDVRQRAGATQPASPPLAESTAESDPEPLPGIDLRQSKTLAQGTNKLEDTLSGVNPRWRNWIIRGIFSIVMISGFSLIVYLGPLAMVLLVIGIQVKCFHEIITIGYTVYKSHDLPWFRTLSWYFLVSSNYFFYGESMINYFGILLSRSDFLWVFVKYHRFLSFALYLGGIVWFVLSLVKRHYIKQFTLFGWTHMTLLIVVASSHLIIQNIFEGVIWFLVSVSMVIMNDIFAYIFGFFFGRTPLIKLSPKKTWEGFIGGAFATVVFSFVLSTVLLRWDFMVCPINYNEEAGALSYECERDHVFQLKEYNLPAFITTLLSAVGIGWTNVHLYPFQLDSIALSLFASILGPFGGFFASGFKRAFKIKDFGDTIPGHGGLMDRFDCQIIMAVFVHVYHSSFIKAPSVARVVQQAFLLKPEDQVKLYSTLQNTLRDQGAI